MKLGDHLRHHGARNAATNADIHRAARQPQPLLDIFLRHPQFFEDQAGMLEKVIAAVSQYHTLAAANKQLGAQHLFQLLNGLGQRRLGKA